MGNQTTVAETTTNTIAGSQTFADVDLRPICENMTTSEFRKVFAVAQGRAVDRLTIRIADLQKWAILHDAPARGLRTLIRTCQLSFTKPPIFTTPCHPPMTNTRLHPCSPVGEDQTLTWQSTTPTASRGTSLTLTKFVTGVTLALSFAHSAFACDGPSNMPGWDFDVRFDNNSSDISTAELAKLSVWSNDMRNRFPIVDVVSVVGLAEPTERRAQELAHRRAANVKGALDQFLIRGERNSMIARIYKLPFTASEYDDNGRRVEITFGPGCPNHCCPNLNPIPKAQ